MISAASIIRLSFVGGRPLVGDPAIPLEVFFDGLKRVVFVDDRRDMDRLGPGDLAVALGRSAGKTASAAVRCAGRLMKKGAVGLLVHERSLEDEVSKAMQPGGPFPVILIDRDVEWVDVLEPLMKLGSDLRKRDSKAESQRAELFRDIIDSRGRVPLDNDAAMRSGLDLTTPARVAYIAPLGDVPQMLEMRLQETVAFELLDHDPSATVINAAGATLALESQTGSAARADRVGHLLLFRARGSLASRDVIVGLGRHYAGAEGIFRSFREARWAAETGHSLHGPNHVMDFGSLGAFAWLEPIDFDGGEQATAAIEEIMVHDARQGARLLDTLQAFLETRRLKEAADRLFIHRNTLRYRLDAIRKLTGFDVQDPDARLVLELQLRLAIVRGLITRTATPSTPDEVDLSEGVVIQLTRDDDDAVVQLDD